MRLVLEAIVANTALWADEVCLEQISGEPMKRMTIKELDDLQHIIGMLRMRARSMLLNVKYEGVNDE